MRNAGETPAGKGKVMSSFVAIQLFGPEFTGPATEISHKVGVGTISTILVYPGTEPRRSRPYRLHSAFSGIISSRKSGAWSSI